MSGRHLVWLEMIVGRAGHAASGEIVMGGDACFGACRAYQGCQGCQQQERKEGARLAHSLASKSLCGLPTRSGLTVFLHSGHIRPIALLCPRQVASSWSVPKCEQSALGDNQDETAGERNIRNSSGLIGISPELELN